MHAHVLAGMCSLYVTEYLYGIFIRAFRRCFVVKFQVLSFSISISAICQVAHMNNNRVQLCHDDTRLYELYVCLSYHHISLCFNDLAINRDGGILKATEIHYR